MNGCQLRECATLGVWNAADAPGVVGLGGLQEVLLDNLPADGIDQNGMGMQFGSHASQYQHSVYIASGQTFIGRAAAMLHKLHVAHDPEFGARLRRFIPLAGFKNPRRFAIDGLGWAEDGGPQKLNNYLKGRIPDVETLLKIADALRVSVSDLLGLNETNSAPDEGLRDILRHLLVLEGIAPGKADTIASVSLAAQRLFQAFPDEESLSTRAKFAARAAWLQQQPQAPNT